MIYEAPHHVLYKPGRNEFNITTTSYTFILDCNDIMDRAPKVEPFVVPKKPIYNCISFLRNNRLELLRSLMLKKLILDL